VPKACLRLVLPLQCIYMAACSVPHLAASHDEPLSANDPNCLLNHPGLGQLPVTGSCCLTLMR
jgi:hypothetical protein